MKPRRRRRAVPPCAVGTACVRTPRVHPVDRPVQRSPVPPWSRPRYVTYPSGDVQCFSFATEMQALGDHSMVLGSSAIRRGDCVKLSKSGIPARQCQARMPTSGTDSEVQRVAGAATAFPRVYCHAAGDSTKGARPPLMRHPCRVPGTGNRLNHEQPPEPYGPAVDDVGTITYRSDSGSGVSGAERQVLSGREEHQ